MFGGRADLLLFDERKVFEAEHANDVYYIDINKGTRVWKAIIIYLDE